MAMEEKSREHALELLLKKLDIEFLYLNPHGVTEEDLYQWVNDALINAELDQEMVHATLESTNYVEVRGSLFKGVRKEYRLQEILDCQERLKEESLACVWNCANDLSKNKLEKAKKLCASCYKIHAMPKNADEYKLMVKKLIVTLKTDTQLQESITSFKLQPLIDFSWPLEEIKKLLEAKSVDGGAMALMVIYIANGKEHAQYALNTLYGLYKDMEGLGIIPRYSKKITDTLSYTQGNGDEKSLFPHCFDLSKVFYAEAFLESKDSFTLINPVETMN